MAGDESCVRSVHVEAEELSNRLFRNAVGALELYTVYVGERLGLYRTLAEVGPATSRQLAARTGTTERYVREWLEHHATAGLVDVDDVTAEPLERRYFLPPDHVAVLADPDHPQYQGYKGVELVRAARPLPDVVTAFRTGGAPPPLPWEPEGRAEVNRAVFLNYLGTTWLPAIPDINSRLRAAPPAHVADIACGSGWSSIAMANAYPMITVDGFDLDSDVVAAATQNSADEGVADRVAFRVADASTVSGEYDLVTIIEALHDMSRPVEALAAARSMLCRGGCVIVVDERTEDQLTPRAGRLEQYHYGWSVVSCLPSAMGDPQTQATGAVMRPSTLRRYAEEAGLGRFEVLDVETDFWRFYRLQP
jgi:2-polyprenyl-3-methyl-5-hydroxy-6-metoxy-1,4-benzoquinol methylase